MTTPTFYPTAVSTGSYVHTAITQQAYQHIQVSAWGNPYLATQTFAATEVQYVPEGPLLTPPWAS